MDILATDLHLHFWTFASWGFIGIAFAIIGYFIYRLEIRAKAFFGAHDKETVVLQPDGRMYFYLGVGSLFALLGAGLVIYSVVNYQRPFGQEQIEKLIYSHEHLEDRRMKLQQDKLRELERIENRMAKLEKALVSMQSGQDATHAAVQALQAEAAEAEQRLAALVRDARTDIELRTQGLDSLPSGLGELRQALDELRQAFGELRGVVEMIEQQPCAAAQAREEEATAPAADAR